MAFRFRRSIRIAPGVRINLGKRGASISAGVRGASVTYGNRGLYGNVGIPGTGVSFRERIGGGPRHSGNAGRASATPAEGSVQISLQDDGTVRFLSPEGEPLPPRLVKTVREQMGAKLNDWLEEHCEHWNQGIARLLQIHHTTPAPSERPRFESAPFDEPPPTAPISRPIGLLGYLWRARREKIEAENAVAQQKYANERVEWEVAAASYASSEDIRRQRFEAAMAGDPDAMANLLEQVITRMDLPWHSGISFEFEGSQRVWIDLDLPEVEDLPRQEASVAARGVRIRVKDRSDTQIRREYAQLVHAITFRVTGETFAALPRVREVIVAAYSQRTDRKTARVQDEYLLSARIVRDAWSQIDFSKLADLDVREAFQQFELIRAMTKTGIFTAITPHER